MVKTAKVNIMFELLTNIDVTVPFLRGVITLIEILFTGFVLYWLWEIGLKLFGRLRKRTVITATGSPETIPAQMPERNAVDKSIVVGESESER